MAPRDVVTVPGSQTRKVVGLGFDPEGQCPPPLCFTHELGDPTTNTGNELGYSHLTDGETEGWGGWPVHSHRGRRTEPASASCWAPTSGSFPVPSQ